MVFSSLIFLYAFLPLSLLAYFLCKGWRAKNVTLLISSLIFYAWGEPKYVLLLIIMALADWFLALQIHNTEDKKRKKLFLIFTCIVDLGLLAVFKYSGFFCSFFGDPPEFIKNIALPIGISFYTFQLLSYVVDVYRGDVPAQKSYFNVLLYAGLFHQCVAGPIVRYSTIADELFSDRDERRDMAAGISRFCVGLSKKVLLANVCGELADKLLLPASTAGAAGVAAIQDLPVLGAWLGIITYAFQIYFDFSAYSDMALGMGQMLGLHYLENFNYPYISKSVSEFWRRWHISLGSFFRDYVYIPLGGNKVSKWHNVFNLFVVWALTGLWHGASWNFVLWGLYYFVFVAAEKLFLGKILKKLPAFIDHIYLIFVVLLGWVLFRFQDLGMVFAVIKSLFGVNGNPVSGFEAVVSLKNHIFFLVLCVVACTPLVKNISTAIRERMCRSHRGELVYTIVFRQLVPITLLLLSTAALVGDSYNPFIYFQF